MVQNMFLIGFFFFTNCYARSCRCDFASRYLMLCKCLCCYFNRDSTEVTTGFLAVTPVPHLNRPLQGVKTGRQFICNGGIERQRREEKEGERNSWMARVETCGLFLSASKQPRQQPHPLRNSWCKKCFMSRFRARSPFSSKQHVRMF